MSYLLLNIICTGLIFIIFKFVGIYRLNLTSIISLNYIVASIFGIIFSMNKLKLSEITYSSWIPLAGLIGLLFVVGFYLIGYSSRVSGITITTVASKMSVIFPVAFSILYYGEFVSDLKILGLCMALIAVFLSVFRSEQNDRNRVFVPLILFVYVGFTDLSLKYSQAEYVDSTLASVFTLTIFIMAAFACIFVFIIKRNWRESFNLMHLPWGILLGMVNYLSIYFLFLALNSSCLDSSIVFTISNAGVIFISTLSGILIFKEKLVLLNYAGIILSLISVVILFNV